MRTPIVAAIVCALLAACVVKPPVPTPSPCTGTDAPDYPWRVSPPWQVLSNTSLPANATTSVDAWFGLGTGAKRGPVPTPIGYNENLTSATAVDARLFSWTWTVGPAPGWEPDRASITNETRGTLLHVRGPVGAYIVTAQVVDLRCGAGEDVVAGFTTYTWTPYGADLPWHGKGVWTLGPLRIERVLPIDATATWSIQDTVATAPTAGHVTLSNATGGSVDLAAGVRSLVPGPGTWWVGWNETSKNAGPSRLDVQLRLDYGATHLK